MCNPTAPFTERLQNGVELSRDNSVCGVWMRAARGRNGPALGTSEEGPPHRFFAHFRSRADIVANNTNRILSGQLIVAPGREPLVVFVFRTATALILRGKCRQETEDPAEEEERPRTFRRTSLLRDWERGTRLVAHLCRSLLNSAYR